MLLSLVHPSMICLQETFLRESKNITFKGFSSYQKPAQEVSGVLHGGSAIFVNSFIPHRQLDLQTGLQAVAIRISCQKTITVGSITGIEMITPLCVSLLCPPPMLLATTPTARPPNVGALLILKTFWGCEETAPYDYVSQSY